MSRLFGAPRSLWLACAVLAGGCSHDELFGPGGGVSVTVTTPAGTQSGDVRIAFTLTDDEETSSDVAIKYSTDGLIYRSASRAAGSAGTTGLAVSSGGTSHTFIWDSARDLDGERVSGVTVRVEADGGANETTGEFSVHNARYLVATHDTTTAKVSLFRLDVQDGDLTRIETLEPGGQRPWDVLFEDGFFYVANRGTNDVTVLAFDADAETLAVVAGSPFATDGTGGKYLATDGDRLFVSNITSATITIFDIDDRTGALSLGASSGVAVAACRTMVVRSGRLYVASETAGEIRVFDIAGSGALTASPFSPVTSGGLASPVALARVGSRLYAADFATATLAGFNIQGDGDLAPIAGSPFTFTGLETLQIAVSGGADRLFLATSSVATLASVELDALGVATEDTSSPHAAAGEVHTVAAAGTIAVTGNADDNSLEAFAVSSTGTLTAGGDNPFDLGDPVGRIAISD